VPEITFGKQLKIWRGGRAQKEVHDIFGVALSTFKSWEQENKSPVELAMPEIMRRMAASPEGKFRKVIPTHLYNPQPKAPSRRDKHRMKVAAEIQNRK
jgi:hypothetical protein